VLVLCATGLIAVGASVVVRRSLEQVEEEQSNTLAAQFHQEYSRRGEEMVVRIRGIAESESTLRMAIDLMSANADPSLYVNDAHVLAVSQHLDFLDFVDSDGKIISSAEWPVHANSSMPWVPQAKDWSARGSFLTRMDTEAGPDLALLAISNAVPVADKRVYVVGGVRVGSDFLRSLEVPPGSRAMIYRNIDPGFSAGNLIDSGGPVMDAQLYAPLINDELHAPIQRIAQIDSGEGRKAHYVQLGPLQGKAGDVLGVFLIEQPEARMVAANRFIVFLALEAALVAFLFGWLARSWSASRIASPVDALTYNVHEITNGTYPPPLETRSKSASGVVSGDEIDTLIRKFNQMAAKLKELQDVAAQGERVSAWRELAGTFASEIVPCIKQFDNTVADLRGWGSEGTESYHHGINDFAAVLATQVERLRTTVDAFADFAKMPMPRMIAVDMNGIAQRVLRASETKFAAAGHPPVVPEVRLQPDLELIHGDPVLLEKAVSNLVSSVVEAMPAGGPLLIKTRNTSQGILLEVSNLGAGLSAEEWRRYTPNAAESVGSTNGYYDPLSLATVQAIVSDHHGSLLIDDEAGVGTRYRVELPADTPAQKEQQKSVAEKFSQVYEVESGNGAGPSASKVVAGTDSANKDGVKKDGANQDTAKKDGVAADAVTQDAAKQDGPKLDPPKQEVARKSPLTTEFTLGLSEPASRNNPNQQ